MAKKENMSMSELLTTYVKTKMALEALDAELTARLKEQGYTSKEAAYKTAEHSAYITWVAESLTLDGARVKALFPDVWKTCQKEKAGYWRKCVK